MSLRVLRTPRAKRDLAEVASFLAEESFQVSERFLDSAQVTFLALAKMPRIGVSREFRSGRFNDVRMWRVRDFEKFLVFHRVLTDAIVVLRVIHGARDIESLFR